MADVFKLPAVGDTMVEGEIVEWFVSVGDEVALDQPICSLETDKSVVEMTTPFRGTVLQLGAEAGGVVAVGSPLIVVGAVGEEVPPQTTAAPPPTLLASEHRSPSVSEGLTLAMPKVRKLARELGVDVHSVIGTGPRGSVTSGDLSPQPRIGNEGDRRERLSATRRAIAAHLLQSVREIPQFTSMVDVNASALLSTRRSLQEKAGVSIPIDALFIAILIPVLRAHPLANAAVDGDEVVNFQRYDIGIAVDTEDGLMVPVIKHAGNLDVIQLAGEVRRLAAVARSRTIHPTELSGATCTVNNVGAVGIKAGTPILPLATSAVVAFGETRPEMQLRAGVPTEVPVMTISATFDHRLLDGGSAGRFLTQLKQHLEVPALGFM